MRVCLNFSARALALCAALCVVFARGRAGAQSQPTPGQQQDKTAGGYRPSADEMKAAQAVQQAADAQAALTAAGAYVKKYAKSPYRAQVAQTLVDKINAVTDVAQRATLAEGVAKLFDRPEDASVVEPFLAAAYVNAGRAADAFKAAGPVLAKNPDDVDLMQGLAIVASNEVIKGNAAYAAQGLQYGSKAIELLEADKKPAGMDDAKWASYKAAALPALYRATGVIAYKTNDAATATARLEKAAALKSPDPGVYLLLSDLTYTQYEQAAKQYQSMPAGAEKDATLKKAESLMDKTIEAYAQAIAVTEGNAAYQAPHDQMKQDIVNLYKFRHAGSTEGLQQLIDKYKGANAKP